MIKIFKNKRIKNVRAKLFLSEFFGTFLFVTTGLCCNAQLTFGRSKVSSDGTAWGWGLALTMSVYASLKTSGSHLNPAVSFGLFSIGRLPLVSLLLYWCAQYLGAFVGSVCTFAMHYEALNIYDGGVRSVVGPNATASIWATYPQEGYSTYTFVVDQIIGPAIFMIFIMAVTDEKNCKVPVGLLPISIGLALVTCLFAVCHNCMGPLNPARDFGPRVFTSIAGWGGDVFKVYNYYFWIPLVMPHLGMVVGAYLYQVFIGWHVFNDGGGENIVGDNCQVEQMSGKKNESNTVVQTF